jgi:hypothetical protein
MGKINERQCEGQEDNVEEVGIEPGTFAYNTRCYNHYIMVAYPDLTISYHILKKVLAIYLTIFLLPSLFLNSLVV